MQQMYRQHLDRLWGYFGSILLGVWLIASPAILGYLDPGSVGPQVEHVTLDRHLAAPELRAGANLERHHQRLPDRAVRRLPLSWWHR
jgi:hypothetical protein